MSVNNVYQATCNICDEKCSSSSILLRHLLSKAGHNLKSNSVFKCGERNCHRQYTNSWSFKRHVDYHFQSYIQSNNNVHPTVSENVPIVFDTNNSIQNLESQEIVERQDNSLINFASDILLDTDYEEPNNANENQNNSMSSGSSVESIDFCLENLFEIGSDFTIKLLGNNSYNRQMVFELTNSIQKDLINPIINTIFEKLGSKNVNYLDPSVCCFLDHCKNVFKMVDTEHKLFKFLKQCNSLKIPEKKIIDKQVVAIIQQPQPIFKEIESFNIYNSIETSITQYLEIGDNFEIITDFMNKMSVTEENECLHFLNSPFWKAKLLKNTDPNVTLIPYDLFNDDYENDSPIGSTSTICLLCYTTMFAKTFGRTVT